MNVLEKVEMKRLSSIASLVALIGLVALPVSAQAALWGYNAIGVGGETDDCIGSLDTCTIEMNTNVNGALGGTSYSKAPFHVSLTVVTSEPIANGFSGSLCYPASGTGSIGRVPGGAINLSTVGMLCDMGSSGAPQGYNGTYFLTGGAGKNAKASGTGNVSASIESSNRLILSIFGVIQR